MDSRPNPKRQLKTSFRPTHLIPPLHTQGPVILTPDGGRIITTTGEEVLLTDVKTGRRLGRIHSDTSEVTSMALSPSGVLAVFTRSLALRYYSIPDAPPTSSSDFLPLDPSSSSGSSSSALSSTAVPLLPLIRHTPRSHPSPILVSVMDPTSTLLASGSADGIVKVWDLAGGFVTHLFRSHGGPVSSLCFNIPREGPAKGKRMELVTGSGDTRVRVFDLKDSNAGGKPRAVLEGHVSVVRGLGTSPDGRWLVSGGRDKVVLVWDLWGGQEDGWERLSAKKEGGAKKGKGKAVEVQLVRTMTVLESLESVGVLATGEVVEGVTNGEGGALLCWTGGEKGVVRVWDARRGTELVSLKGAAGVDVGDEEEDGEDQRGIVEVQYNPATNTLLSVHSDQNILFHSLKTNLVSRQLVGYNDEIIDSIFLSPSSSISPTPRDSYLALATNSSLIRVYSTSTFDARLLPGHSDMVLCLDRSKGGEWLVSGSKDRTARVWSFVPSQDIEGGGAGDWKCLAICEGHAESVGAVAVSRRVVVNDGTPSSTVKAKFLFTASQDRTIKMWDLNSIDVDASEPAKPKSLLTQKIHEKDINSLDLSPNDRFLASGSQDKLVKVFEVSYSATSKSGGQAVGSVNLVGTCKGHKRGVWSVKFSKTDRVLATGSGDKTVKIWSLDDFSCLKTFEGHSNSVLRIDFLSLGQQLISSSSDGLVKLWNVKDEECVASLDNHEDKIWALAVSEDERTIVSGAADSMVTFWGDCTEVDEKEKVAKLEKSVLNEQNFANYVNLKDYRNAILLALAMSQPGRLLSLFTSVRSNRPPPPLSASLLDPTSSSTTSQLSSEKADALSITGSAAVDQVIKTLPGLDLVRLLGHVRDWNARAKTSPVAQTILHAILRLRTAEEIVKAFEASTKVWDDLKDAEEEAAAAAEENGAEEDDKKKRRGGGGGGKKIAAGAGLDLSEILDAMVPYTERHFERAERMVQECFVLDFALSEMDGGLFGFEFDGGVDEEEEEDVEMS